MLVSVSYFLDRASSAGRTTDRARKSGVARMSRNTGTRARTRIGANVNSLVLCALHRC